MALYYTIIEFRTTKLIATQIFVPSKKKICSFIVNSILVYEFAFFPGFLRESLIHTLN